MDQELFLLHFDKEICETLDIDPKNLGVYEEEFECPGKSRNLTEIDPRPEGDYINFSLCPGAPNLDEFARYLHRQPGVHWVICATEFTDEFIRALTEAQSMVKFTLIVRTPRTPSMSLDSLAEECLWTLHSTHLPSLSPPVYSNPAIPRHVEHGILDALGISDHRLETMVGATASEVHDRTTTLRYIIGPVEQCAEYQRFSQMYPKKSDRKIRYVIVPGRDNTTVPAVPKMIRLAATPFSPRRYTAFGESIQLELFEWSVLPG